MSKRAEITERGVATGGRRAPSRDVMQHKQRTTADVYEDLVRRSFSMFLRRYFERLLREPPAAALPDIELPPEDSPSAG